MNRPALNYICTLLTGGLFGFYWLFRMASELDVPNNRLKAKVFSVVFGLYLLVVLFLMTQVPNSNTESANYIVTYLIYLLFAFVAVLFYLSLSTLSAVSRSINAMGGRAPKGIVLYLLFAFYLIALPVLQAKINGGKSEPT